jgi:hypothetical protein
LQNIAAPPPQGERERGAEAFVIFDEEHVHGI